MQKAIQHFDRKMFFIIDKVSYLAIFIHIFLIGLFFWLDYLILSFANIFFLLFIGWNTLSEPFSGCFC